MIKVKRFGVSLEDDLLNALDALVKKHHFPNRSQAIRYLVKKHMIEDDWNEDRYVAGAIILLYDHHRKDLSNKTTSLQHEYHDMVLSVQHVHLDHNNCLETIAVKGHASRLKLLADKMIAVKGIKHGKLLMTATS